MPEESKMLPCPHERQVLLVNGHSWCADCGCLNNGVTWLQHYSTRTPSQPSPCKDSFSWSGICNLGTMGCMIKHPQPSPQSLDIKAAAIDVCRSLGYVIDGAGCLAIQEILSRHFTDENKALRKSKPEAQKQVDEILTKLLRHEYDSYDAMVKIMELIETVSK